jgi:hypothetical protein
MLFVDSVSRNAAKVVVGERQNLHEVPVTLVKTSMVRNWVRSTECGRRYSPPTSPFTLVSIHQDICDMHLQYTTLLWISPTSFNILQRQHRSHRKMQLTTYWENHWRPVSRVHVSLKVVWFSTNTFLLCTNDENKTRIGDYSFIVFKGFLILHSTQ